MSIPHIVRNSLLFLLGHRARAVQQRLGIRGVTLRRLAIEECRPCLVAVLDAAAM